MNDLIRLDGLQFYSSVFGSPWSSIDVSNSRHAGLQPVIVSVEIQHDLQAAGHSDDLSHSVDYSRVSKKVRDACCLSGVDGLIPETPYGLAERILDLCLQDIEQPIRRFAVELEFPKLVLRAKSARVNLEWRKGDVIPKRHSFCIGELPVHAIVGLRAHEREDKQPVIICLKFEHAKSGNRSLYFNFSKLERRISDFVEASAYMTIEALTLQIARESFLWLDDPASFTVTVTVAKPAAISMARAPVIRLTRSLSDFPLLTKDPSGEQGTAKTFASLSLGANLGDRFQNIELALRYLENFRALSLSDLPPSGQLELVDTSFLYESAPMYLESQPAFINCACLVETTFSPRELLRICKHIEETVGRVPSERFGPRAIDLDIVTFGDIVVDTRASDDRTSLDNLAGQLVIPHPRMPEREFVLRPLKDIIPEWVHPRLHLSVRSLLGILLLEQPSTLDKVIPFPFSPNERRPAEHRTPSTQTYWILPNPNASRESERTRLERRYTMATLNVTPDSFSDGGEHNTLNNALTYARDAVAAGADIIDIGGYSTRPGAVDISSSEEIARVVPVIHAICADTDSELRSIPISIDTFRVDVARAALDAGANCINDVYAFAGGPEFFPPSSTESAKSASHFADMKELARERNVPVVMMHSRGHADKNKDYSRYDIAGSENSVVEGVRAELGEKVVRATKGSRALRRWQVVVDPGVGFSKDVNGNLQILRKAGSLIADTLLPSGVLPFYESTISKYTSPHATPNWNPLAGFPLLIGASRKSFLGPLIAAPLLPTNKDTADGKVPEEEQRVDRPAKERDFATAATVACAMQQGAAIVRVHAVREMVDVVKVAAAIWSRD